MPTLLYNQHRQGYNSVLITHSGFHLQKRGAFCISTCSHFDLIRLNVTADTQAFHKSGQEDKDNFYVETFYTIYNRDAAASSPFLRKQSRQTHTHRHAKSFSSSFNTADGKQYKHVSGGGGACGFKHKLQCCEHSFPLKMLIWPLLWGADTELTVITWPDLHGKHINKRTVALQPVNPLLNLGLILTCYSRSGRKTISRPIKSTDA